MKYIKFAIIGVVVVLTTGCWNYRALEKMAIVGAIGIDVEKDGVLVSAEIINPKKVGSSSGSGGNNPEETDFVVYSVKAKTIKDAINQMVLEAPKALYVGHVNLVVFSEEAAKKGLINYIDYFLRDTEARKIFTSVIVKNDKAINAIRILQPLEPITSTNIQASFEATSQVYGAISNQSFDEFVECLYTQGRHPTLAAIEIFGSPEKGGKNSNLSSTISNTTIKIIGTAIFKNDKLIGYISTEEAQYYSLVRGKTKTLSLSFPCDNDGNYANVVIDQIKDDTKIKIRKEKPEANMNIVGKAALTEYNCKLDLREPKNITVVEQLLNKQLTKDMKELVKKIQDYNSDVLGFGERLYRNNNAYWEKNKKNWDDIFPEIVLNVKSNIEIERLSSTIDAAKK